MLPSAQKIFSTPFLLGLSLLIVILDQLTKYLCDTYLSYGIPYTVFQGFDLLLAYNEGAAFSFLSDAGGWQRYLLTGLSLVVSIFILGWLLRLPKQQEKILALALCLILAGAVGNLYDRIMYGYVVDFISVYYRQYRFATFNIADSSVFCGALLMIIEMFRNKSSEQKGDESDKGNDGDEGDSAEHGDQRDQ